MGILPDTLSCALYKRMGYEDGLAGKPPNFLVSFLPDAEKIAIYDRGYNMGLLARNANSR